MFVVIFQGPLSEELQIFSENFRTFSEDYRRQVKIQRCFDYTSTNSLKGQEIIFQKMISSHVSISYHFYQFVNN